MRITLLATTVLLTLATHAADAFRIEKDIAYLAPDRKEKADLYLPANSPAGARRPAVVIIHGVRQSSSSTAAGRAATRDRHELIIIEGAPHTFHLQPKQRDLRPVVLGFFDKHLKAAR